MKCARPSCPRQEQTAGLCKPHYALATRGMPTGKVDVAPVIEHIKALATAGVSNARVGKLTGIPQNNIWQIVNGHRQFVFASTAAKILAIPPPHVAWSLASDGALTPLVGSQRRLRALMAFGYPGRMLARQIGVQHAVINKITAGNQKHVTARVARAIAELFDELQLTPGPSQISRRRAAVRGWALPLAWDEDSIDDPNAEPEELGSTHTTQLEQYRELRYLGFDSRTICERLGLKPYMEKNLREAS